MMFAIRAETTDGHFDAVVGGRSLDEARSSFQKAHENLAPFDWRGAVVFCQGEQPAESTSLNRKKILSGWATGGIVR